MEGVCVGAPMMTVAEATAEALMGAGVSHLYGIPGGEVLDLLEAVRARDLPFILVGHETSAAFMAEVEYRLSGRPGAALATLGPGATNLVTGLAHCYLDRAAVLGITGSFGRDVEERGTHQVLDQARLFGSVVKASWTLRPPTAPLVLRRALRLSEDGRPGPVHLTLSGEDAQGEVRGDHWRPPRQPKLPQVEGTTLARAAALLEASRRPLIFAGIGALAPGVPRALQDLVDHLRVPILVTPKAKGVVDEEGPAFLGVAGLGMAADAIMLEALGRSDLILLVGYDPVEVVPSWLDPWNKDVPIIRIDAVPDPGHTTVEVDAVGDPADALARLGARFHAGAPLRWAEGELEEVRRHVEEAYETPSSRGVPPLDVVLTLRRLTPSDTIVAVDVGSHKIVACQAWSARRPGTFLVSNGLSSMGYGLPAANAAKLLRPTAPVICLTGDGGLLMALHEFEVTKRLGLSPLVLVFDDACLALIKEKQQRRAYPPYGMDFVPPDWPRLAEAFGFRGYKVERQGELEGAIKEALGTKGPTLVDVAIDWEAYRPAL